LLLQETRSGIRPLHVNGLVDAAAADTFPNGFSLMHGVTTLCGPHRGEVVVVGFGRKAAGVLVTARPQRFVQHGDSFVRGRPFLLAPLRRPLGSQDFGNCRPWIPARSR
jgi:hypothetical protein